MYIKAKWWQGFSNMRPLHAGTLLLSPLASSFACLSYLQSIYKILQNGHSRPGSVRIESFVY